MHVLRLLPAHDSTYPVQTTPTTRRCPSTSTSAATCSSSMCVRNTAIPAHLCAGRCHHQSTQKHMRVWLEHSCIVKKCHHHTSCSRSVIHIHAYMLCCRVQQSHTLSRSSNKRTHTCSAAECVHAISPHTIEPCHYESSKNEKWASLLWSSANVGLSSGLLSQHEYISTYRLAGHPGCDAMS